MCARGIVCIYIRAPVPRDVCNAGMDMSPYVLVLKTMPPNTVVRKHVQAGSGTCTDCPAGKHQATEGSIACDNCEAGKYQTTVGATSESDCTPCAAGIPGTLSITPRACCTRANHYPWCLAGTYTLHSGATVCTSCPDNANAPQGSAALSACSCNAGYTGANGGACSACPAGAYKDISGVVQEC